MEENEEIYIEKLSEYIKYVEELPNEFILSRGQGGEYSLLPSALRTDKKGNRKYSRQSIAYFLKEFKINSYHYMSEPWDVKNEFEWMIYGQHYGIPTRLLDFTKSHIISLMFAVEEAFSSKKEGNVEVWFLNPKKLNLKFANRAELLSINEDQNLNFERYNGPVALQGRKLNVRINAQNGMFVYFRDSDNPLEKLVDNNILRKIIIQEENKKDILSSLHKMGIGFSQIYPELSYVAKDILMKKNITDFIRGGQ